MSKHLGSINVLADNLSKGIYGETKAKEADFLYGLLDDVEGVKQLMNK